MQHSPGDDAEAEAVGNGIGKRDQDQGEEGGTATRGSCQRISVMVASMSEPTRMSAGAVAAGGRCPQKARRRLPREKATCDDGRDAAAAACHDAGGRLHVAGYGRSSSEGAEDAGGGIGKQNPVEAGDGVVGGDEASALGDGDQGAQVIEQVTKKKTKTISSKPLLRAPRMSSLKAVPARAWRPPGAGVQRRRFCAQATA